MDHTKQQELTDYEIEKLEDELELFFTSASGRRGDVSVSVEPKHSSVPRKVQIKVDCDIGFEDEAKAIQNAGFTIYTIGGSLGGGSPRRAYTNLIVKVPERVPEKIAN